MTNTIAIEVQMDILNRLHLVILSNGEIIISPKSFRVVHNDPDINTFINRSIIITVFILLTFQIPDIRGLLCYINLSLHLKVY